ncbi:MAG TPA: hypothetical protein VGO00_03790 [Kofleriaceae bacterium]|nr:hypothetical protein [Kofleriaceae bacterium]
MRKVRRQLGVYHRSGLHAGGGSDDAGREITARMNARARGLAGHRIDLEIADREAERLDERDLALCRLHEEHLARDGGPVRELDRGELAVSRDEAAHRHCGDRDVGRAHLGAHVLGERPEHGEPARREAARHQCERRRVR